MASSSDLNDIRRAFVEYFRARGHEHIASSSLVPEQDPSLLFTNSGMVQFKGVFTGVEERPCPRAITAQKCLRAGGKHNDLDNVGHTARHHTFFEMLGNFSFGDYFKEHAVELAWRLVAHEFGLPESRLWISVYVDDDEAHDLWRKITGLPHSRILRISGSDNFWSMGDTGPCGPCSEIFFDHGESVAGGPPGSADAEGDRFTEIWNLVFMQYEQRADGERVSLPRPSIDTGMGLERMGAVLQGVHDNYDTDLFRFLIDASVKESGVSADGEHMVAHRVIADHLRASGFLIADGVLPDNEGRGYVLRRIMRRAMRHAFLLGVEEPLLCRLSAPLITSMGEAYPELLRARALIEETLRSEELRFRETLARGLSLLRGEVGVLSKGQKLPGEVAFRLYDTYGFPVDLTADVLREQNLEVDVEGFEEAMVRRQKASRSGWTGSGDENVERLWYALREDVGASEFVGYEEEDAEADVCALVSKGEALKDTSGGGDIFVLTDKTPFYAEGGGQVGDTGELARGNGELLKVKDTRRQAESLIIHCVDAVTLREPLRVGERVKLRIDSERRRRTRANHSATHLLHEALRRVLGEHVVQRGSLVSPDYLRFDFSHGKPLSMEELSRIEGMVNAHILENDAIETRVMRQEDALSSGALALFGERYADEVRVLFMGRDKDAFERSGAYSVEFCGGTHVARLGDIGLFKITSQSSVASGVRRVEALSGESARRHLLGFESLVIEVADLLKTTPDALLDRINKLIEENRNLKKGLKQDKQAVGWLKESLPGKVAFWQTKLEDVDAKEMRSLVDLAKHEIGSGVIVLASVSAGKVRMIVGVTRDLAPRIDARVSAKAAADRLGGKGGGGREDMAQCGGDDVSNVNAALEAVKVATIASLKK